jgi:hypothetical protein
MSGILSDATKPGLEEEGPDAFGVKLHMLEKRQRSEYRINWSLFRNAPSGREVFEYTGTLQA